MTPPDSEGPSPGFKTFAVGADLDTDKTVSVEMTGVSLARALRVGVAGDVAIQCGDGTTGILYAVQAGELIVVQVSKLLKVGTTARSISLFK